MRIIRVKQNNQASIITGLQEAGYDAMPAPCPPSEQGYEWATDYPSQFDKVILQDTQGMAGIQTSASGKQAHKIISQLRDNGVI